MKKMQVPHSRKNHYVPKWHQKRFSMDDSGKLYFLDLSPKVISRPDGSSVTLKNVKQWPYSSGFVQKDLYTTFFGEDVNDDIERMLFGRLDDAGSRAVSAFVGTDEAKWHEHFEDFFTYIDAQKIRTPKGLSWLKAHYPKLSQIELMREMQAIRNLHCSLWAEGVREIVSAENCSAKFIVTDHPVTVYNYAHPPSSKKCQFPYDPSIKLAGTQTLFALDKDHLLIFTHYDYAKNPEKQNPEEDRINSRMFRNSFVHTGALIHGRILQDVDVLAINFVLKSRAAKYVAAGTEDLLYPERHSTIRWEEIRNVLLPPKNEIWRFGGEIFVGYKDGTTHYQDAHGRTVPQNPHLLKSSPCPSRLGKNDPCGCGSGRPYKQCCRNKSENQRPSWKELSIRERNLALLRAVNDILGLDRGKKWDDVRREINEEHVKKIHAVYEALWPPYTDILSLFPKPDNELRALYTGIIDPRTISVFATSLAPYFDQLLIQSPFVNSACVASEYKPTESPGKYLYQTLKNVLVLLTLEPFIDAGFVNMFPDPCDFDFHLRSQMMEMAKRRHPGKEIEEGDEDKELVMSLGKDELMRHYLSSSRSVQRSFLLKGSPEISDDDLERMLDLMEKMKINDPLTILREGSIYGDEGQLQMLSMAPNFELAMYIAQATGSIIVTHSQLRWNEIQKARQNPPDVDGASVDHLCNTLHSLEHRLHLDPCFAFQSRLNGPYAHFRAVLRKLVQTARPTAGAISKRDSREIAKDLVSGSKKAMDGIDPSADHVIKAKFQCLMPKDGLVHNNVQRLLLTSGNENHLDSVAMALRLEFEGWNIDMSDSRD